MAASGHSDAFVKLVDTNGNTVYLNLAQIVHAHFATQRGTVSATVMTTATGQERDDRTLTFRGESATDLQAALERRLVNRPPGGRYSVD